MQIAYPYIYYLPDQLPIIKQRGDIMTKSEQIIELTNHYGAHNYVPLPIVISIYLLPSGSVTHTPSASAMTIGSGT
jgi:hypothetical protein